MKSLSNAEWEVMRVIWAKQEVTSQAIIDVLATNMNWQPSTIKTLLIRLGEKKYIQAQKQGRKFLYTAVVNETEALQQELAALIEKTCATKRANLLCSMIDNIALDDKMKEQVIQALQQKTTQSVHCTCIKGQCNCHHEGGVEHETTICHS